MLSMLIDKFNSSVLMYYGNYANYIAFCIMVTTLITILFIELDSDFKSDLTRRINKSRKEES